MTSGEVWVQLGVMVGVVVVVVVVVCLVVLKIYLKKTSRECGSARRLDGRVAVVTGANTGIGFQVALGLASRGARVVLACRDAGRGHLALQRLLMECPTASVHLQQLDVSLMASVRAFVAEFRRLHTHLDILVNNVGVPAASFRHRVLTGEGLEVTWATNYLGPFLLTELLRDLLIKGHARGQGHARVVNVSSVAHYTGRLDLTSISDNTRNVGLNVYADTKFAQVLISNYQSCRWRGDGVSVFSCHPGTVFTNIWRRNTNAKNPVVWLFSTLARPFFKTPREGAQTPLYCALDETLEGASGGYFSECRKVSEAAAARSITSGRHLSAEMTGLNKDGHC